jgi:hypothetical protein
MIDRRLVLRLGQWIAWMVGVSSVLVVLRGLSTGHAIRVILVSVLLGILFGAIAHFRDGERETANHEASLTTNPRAARLFLVALFTYWGLAALVAVFINVGAFLLLNTLVTVILFNYQVQDTTDGHLTLRPRAIPWTGRLFGLLVGALMTAISIYAFRFTLR